MHFGSDTVPGTPQHPSAGDRFGGDLNRLESPYSAVVNYYIPAPAGPILVCGGWGAAGSWAWPGWAMEREA